MAAAEAGQVMWVDSENSTQAEAPWIHVLLPRPYNITSIAVRDKVRDADVKFDTLTIHFDGGNVTV